MTPEPKKQPNTFGRRVAVTITFVLLALAIQDQLSSGSVDSPLLGALIVLGFGWAGWGTEQIAEVEHLSDNTCRVHVAHPFGGTAYFN